MRAHLILTHENTDFDGLASQLAAHKLYPQALPVLPRHTNRNLRDFLTLYWDELPYIRYDDLPRRIEVERITLVDAQTLVTPRGMSEETTVQIVDHHPLTRELPPGWSFSGGEAGATTTLLVERIISAGLSLTPVEATLLALGIYEDTGSLTYASTTIRDLRCVTWLAEHGTNIEVVSRFLHQPLTDAQRVLFDALVDSAKTLPLAGHTVLIATAEAPEYVEEISTLAHKVRELFEPGSLFLVVDQREHLQLVARSTDPAVDVGHIARHLGGGGHERAAAALIRGESLESVRARLEELLPAHVRPAVTVSEIMSHGVRTLPEQTTVAEAAEAMLKYGFEGFPIVGDEGQILGVLSRREIDRASRLNLGTLPVAQTMTKGDIHVSPEDSLAQLQQVMIQFGVGQVPVVRGGEVVGVVTRTDLIKQWAAPQRRALRPSEIALKIQAVLPGPLLELVRQVSELAQEMGTPLYVVGGFVRDLLLGEPTLDMDLVVEGDAIRLARRLARRIGAATRSHQRFGTAKILLEDLLSASSMPEGYGIPSLDFATARMEFYAHSAALPEVERSSIKADLHRRDFTINTLAIRLDSGLEGELLDFYGGEHDLQARLIRVLHSLSFVEDPTRIMRAARFEQRLGFSIEPRTAELIDNALPMLSRVTGERIRHELYLILREQEPERALRRLDEQQVLAHVHPRLQQLGQKWELFRRLRQALASGAWEAEQENGRPAPGLYLALLTHDLPRLEVEALGSRLRIFHHDLDLLRQVTGLGEREPQLDRPELSNREVYALVQHASPSAVLVRWLAAESERVRERLWHYDQELRRVRTAVDGNYLKNLGLKPSPLFSKLLHAVRDARLDGLIHTVEEEKALVARLLAERQGES